MKNIIDVYESLLDEIEDTMKAGDEYEKMYEEAKKDWKALLNTKRAKKITSDIYRLHIKSSSLAKYLCMGMKDIDISDLEYVDIEFYIEDVLWSREHHIKINVASEYYIKVQATNIKYDDGKNASDLLPVREAVKQIIKNISNSKYLQDLDIVKDTFDKNITYKRK